MPNGFAGCRGLIYGQVDVESQKDPSTVSLCHARLSFFHLAELLVSSGNSVLGYSSSVQPQSGSA